MNYLKKILFTSSILIFASCATTNLPPTGIVDEEVERANTIVLFVESSQEEAYRNMAQHLMDKGFSFSNTDNTLLTISTEPNTLDYLSHSISLNISIRNIEEQTAIFLSGNVHSGFLGTSRISNVGGSSSIYSASWNDMKNIASDFSYYEMKFRRD